MIVFRYYDKCIELKPLTYADWLKNPVPRIMYAWGEAKGNGTNNIISTHASKIFVTEMLPDNQARCYWEGYETEKESKALCGKGLLLTHCAEIPEGTVPAETFYKELKQFERLGIYKNSGTTPEAVMERLETELFKNDPRFSVMAVWEIRKRIDRMKAEYERWRMGWSVYE